MKTMPSTANHPAWRWPATGSTWHIHHSGGVDAAKTPTLALATHRLRAVVPCGDHRGIPGLAPRFLASRRTASNPMI